MPIVFESAISAEFKPRYRSNRARRVGSLCFNTAVTSAWYNRVLSAVEAIRSVHRASKGGNQISTPNKKAGRLQADWRQAANKGSSKVNTQGAAYRLKRSLSIKLLSRGNRGAMNCLSSRVSASASVSAGAPGPLRTRMQAARSMTACMYREKEMPAVVSVAGKPPGNMACT